MRILHNVFFPETKMCVSRVLVVHWKLGQIEKLYLRQWKHLQCPQLEISKLLNWAHLSTLLNFKGHTAKNYIQELQVFWSMLRRFVSQHIAGYRKVGASYTYIQGFMSYDSVTTIMDAATTILYLPTFFLGWGTKKLYLHHIKNIRLCNHKMCSSTTFM